MNASRALAFVVAMGVVSLFADVTYEGGRAIVGPYFAILSASGFVVAMAAGTAEFLGYGLRLLSGYLSDKTQSYWAFIFLGYGLNLLVVPCLALVGSWPMAFLLVVLERVGKAIRTPSRDVLLSEASAQVGLGKGFGLHEALDQIGAVGGPLFVAAILFLSGSYRLSFAALLLPALLALIFCARARGAFPGVQPVKEKVSGEKFSPPFWLALAAASFIALGFADFPLLAFHFKRGALVPDRAIPLLYALAMGVDAGAAIFLGKLFDRLGAGSLFLATALSLFFAPLVFLGRGLFPYLGVALWGIGMGSSESILKAQIAHLVSPGERGMGFGIFHGVFGLSWFLGSALMGLLYSRSLIALVLFSLASQAAALFLFGQLQKKLA